MPERAEECTARPGSRRPRGVCTGVGPEIGPRAIAAIVQPRPRCLGREVWASTVLARPRPDLASGLSGGLGVRLLRWPTLGGMAKSESPRAPVSES
jgi:hypothetical protein